MRPGEPSDLKPRDQSGDKRFAKAGNIEAQPAAKRPGGEPVSYPIGGAPPTQGATKIEPSEKPPVSKGRQADDIESVSLGGLYFLLAIAALMFGVWFIGPKLVEEYHYAAAIGTARAEYDNAVDRLKEQPLSRVSQAFQLVAQKVRPSVVSVNATQIESTGQ